MLSLRRSAVSMVTVASVLLALGATALAGSDLRPKLGYPDGKNVHTGSIALRVKDTDTRPGGVPVGVFVSIAPARRTDRHGLLKHGCDTSQGCDFVQLKRWRHHKGWWTYRAQFSFPGYWAVTPHRYYWQAQNADCFHYSDCTNASKIGSFRVVG